MQKEHTKSYWVYLLTNWNNRVLYVGVTNDIARRVFEHKTKSVPGFTAKYNVCKLVYVEETTDVLAVLRREKQIKSWRRAKKNQLVESINPTWQEILL